MTNQNREPETAAVVFFGIITIVMLLTRTDYWFILPMALMFLSLVE
jgi:hypothetical protein